MRRFSRKDGDPLRIGIDGERDREKERDRDEEDVNEWEEWDLLREDRDPLLLLHAHHTFPVPFVRPEKTMLHPDWHH